MQWVPVLAKFNSYLTTAVDADDTSVILKSVTSIPTAPFYAVLDGGSSSEELVLVTVVTTATKTLTVTRAQGGTTGVAHAVDTLFHAVGAIVAAGDDALMGGANKLYIRDSGIYIYSSADGQLDIVADTTVAISGAVTMDSTLNVAGVTTLAGVTIITAALYLGVGVNVTGAGIFNSGISVAGTTTVQALVAGGGASVAGTCNLQTVIVGSSLAIAAGGTLTLPQTTDATQLPSADPSVAGELWCNSNVVTRSAG